MKSLIIAGTHSGSGKTTITLGIMECLKRRGLRVAPFKVGPDFIDPGYHRLVTGKPSINLDGWMCSENFVQETFFRHLEGSDIAVIEGVMGLFDGIGGNSDAGSTAQIAKIIGSPVILLVDAKSQARSAAALVKGFAEFDPRVRIAGVIFNNVGSDGHARVLREAVESLEMGIKVVGCLPRDERLHIPSRHLGLTTVEENPLSGEFIELLVEILWDRLDLGLLWASGTQYGVEQNLPWIKQSAPRGVAGKKGRVRLALARDSAFCFVYEDNLRLLREAGADIVEFSPLADRELPEGTAGIYLPGGYPELFADALSGNVDLKRAIKGRIADGMPVYAECGGFIYLTRGVKAEPWEEKEEAPTSGGTPAGRNTTSLHEFVGVFPVITRMLPRRKALGYREVKIGAGSIFGPSGIEARGHEFHYSEMGEMPKRVKRAYEVSRNNVPLGKEGYIHKNCLASYIHLHFGSCPGIAEAFVENCRGFKTGKSGSATIKSKRNLEAE